MDVSQNGTVDSLLKMAAPGPDLQNPSWILAIGGALVVILLIKLGSQRRFGKLPPGPRNWPIVGAILETEPRLYKCFEKLAAQYGPILYFRVGVQHYVIVSSAEVAKELLTSKDAEFADRSAPSYRNQIKFLGFNSTLFPFANYDDQLKLIKKISTTEFFSSAKLRATEKIRTREMAVMVDKIFVKSEDSQDVPIREAAIAMIQNVLFTLCFGTAFDESRSNERLKNFPHLFEEFMDSFMVFGLVDYFPFLRWLDPQGLIKQFKKVRKTCNDFYGAIVQDRKRVRKLNREGKLSEDLNGNSRNFVDILLSAQEEGGPLTDDGVMATIHTMLLAGVDTTAGGIDWLILELARHPEVCNKLHAEIDAVVGKERSVQESDLQAMPYLQAVAMESLRLHPPVSGSFAHVNMKQSSLGGYTIPAKTAVVLNIYAIGRDPKIWENPLQFNPDRFMPGGASPGTPPPNKTIVQMASGSNYNFLPYGSGRRRCAGYDMANVLLLRTVATLVHAFDWSVPKGISPQDLRTEEAGPFLPHPIDILLLVATPRLARHVYQSNIN